MRKSSLKIIVIQSFFFFFGHILFFNPLCQGATKTQKINLSAGWNLVAFQVAPVDPAPAAVFAELGNDFVAAWVFDNDTTYWYRYLRPDLQNDSENAIYSMGNLEIGMAYWIYMNTAVNWDLEGDEPDEAPMLYFEPGWNLVGFPSGADDLTESISLLSVLAVAGDKYDMLVKWENSMYKKYTPSDADVDDFTMFDKDKGHWVHVTSAFTIQPNLVSSVRADVDVSPQGNYPSFEDFQLSDSPTPLGPADQTHIVFLEGEDTQQLAISNTGGGVMLWEIEWTPTDAAETDWLKFSSTKGVTTIESDVVYIYLDRIDLWEGSYSGTLTLKTTAENRTFTVIANVPGLQGEWRGKADIETVNGMFNALPTIDLHLDFYSDVTAPGLIRGLIDSHNALLWPVDVPLIGNILSSNGNSFTLSGAYILPPGDQNIPPYDEFGNVYGDVDWTCDDGFDTINPFPFPVYRSVTMLGQMTDASPVDGYKIEGTYIEVIHGMLRNPIEMHGEFNLTQDNFTPFSNRNPDENEESVYGTLPVVLKKENSSTTIPVGSPGVVNKILNFSTDMVLQDISVTIDIGGDAEPADLKISLQSPPPENIVVVLHDRAGVSALTNVTYPDIRTPVDSMDTFVTNGATTNGDWTLTIENYGSVVGILNWWSLELQGQPVFSIHGRVIDGDTTTGLAAQVMIEGIGVTAATTAATTGNFSFTDIPAVPINFTASYPGYEPYDTSNPGIDTSFTIPDYSECVDLSGLGLDYQDRFRPMPGLPIPPSSIAGFGNDWGSQANPVIIKLKRIAGSGTEIEIQARPTWGPAPLEVTFTLADPLSTIPTSTLITWDFDDGSNDAAIDLYSIAHTFTDSRDEPYAVTAEVDEGGTYSIDIYVLPSPGHSSYTFNIFQPWFCSGGSIPANMLSQPTPITPYMMVQHVDCASFDLDRAPFVPYGGGEPPPYQTFSDDGLTGNHDVSGVQQTVDLDNQGNNNGEDSNYVIGMSCTPDDDAYPCCGYTVDEDNYNPYPQPLAAGDCVMTRYRMVNSIGPLIIPATWAYVQPGSPATNTAPDPPNDPTVDGIAKTKGLRLVIGPLGCY